MLSNRDTGCSEPSPRAPGVGPAGSRRRGRRGPGRDLRGAPRGHPWTPGRFAKWWVRSPGKRPLLRGRASPRPSLRGLLRGASLVPPFWEVRRHLQPKRPFRPASFQCSLSRVPPGFPRASSRLPRGVGETKTSGNGRPDPPGGRHRPAPRRGGGREEARQPAVPAPRAVSALPAGKLQRRKARVGQNPRADRPAPLPIPIHPARPVTTSLSLEEEFRRKAENQSRCAEKAASLRRREQRAGRLGPPRPRAPGAPPPRVPRPRHPSPGPLQCRPGPAAPAAAPPAPSRSGFSAAREGWGSWAGTQAPGCGAGRGDLGDPRARGAPRLPTQKGPSPRAG